MIAVWYRLQRLCLKTCGVHSVETSAENVGSMRDLVVLVSSYAPLATYFRKRFLPLSLPLSLFCFILLYVCNVLAVLVLLRRFHCCNFYIFIFLFFMRWYFHIFIMKEAVFLGWCFVLLSSKETLLCWILINCTRTYKYLYIYVCVLGLADVYNGISDVVQVDGKTITASIFFLFVCYNFMCCANTQYGIVDITFCFLFLFSLLLLIYTPKDELAVELRLLQFCAKLLSWKGMLL